VEGGGGGLVTLVTLPEKPVNPPITFDANEETLFTTEAANAEPGIVGSETVLGMDGPAVEVDGTEVGLAVEVDGRGTLGS
jgi:hypothetical protein